MKQFSFWEANSHSASQEIPRLSWNPKTRYCVNKSLPMVPNLSQMHSVHTLAPYFPKIYSNIIPHQHLGLPSALFPSVFQPKFCMHLSHACYLPCQSHDPSFLSTLKTGKLLKCDGESFGISTSWKQMEGDFRHCCTQANSHWRKPSRHGCLFVVTCRHVSLNSQTRPIYCLSRLPDWEPTQLHLCMATNLIMKSVWVGSE